MCSELDEAVSYYDDLLGHTALAGDSAAALQAGQRERRLVFGEHPLSVALRPQLVERSTYEAAKHASETIDAALCRLEEALLRDAALRAELDLLPEEEKLALAEPGYARSSAVGRLDGFFTDELRYVEYNAESPAGVAYSDHLNAVFDDLPVMRAFRRRYRLTPLPVMDHQLDAMLACFREWGGRRTPVVAIVDWPGLPTLTEFEMFRDLFHARGVRAVICEPAALEFGNGTLRACGETVNLVYRRVLTSELIAKEGDEHRALRDAYLAGAACVVNSFRSKLLHKKMSLALLSDERYAWLYTPQQRLAIARHVPWTRKLCAGPTTRCGREIADLAEYVCAHRDELVLKPNDEYGGKGVVLGWTVDEHEWAQAVEVALTQSYVVQEAVAVPRLRFPVALGDVHFLDLSADMDPYLFAGRVQGILTRLSSSALLNVTAGAGSVVPTYVLEGRV